MKLTIPLYFTSASKSKVLNLEFVSSRHNADGEIVSSGKKNRLRNILNSSGQNNKVSHPGGNKCPEVEHQVRSNYFGLVRKPFIPEKKSFNLDFMVE